MPTKSSSQGGYTLLELLVVLALIAMVLVIAPGYVSSDRGYQRLKLEAYRLETDLRSARSRATFENRTVAFSIDVAGGSWQYRNRTSHAVPKQVRLELFTGRQLLSGDTAGAIQFFPNGQSSGGHVTMVSEGHIVQIDVDWLTGRVHQHHFEERN